MTRQRIAILDAVPKKFWKEDGGITDGMKFRELLSAHNPAAEYAIYYVAEDQWPASLDAHDGWMLSGSPCSVNDDFDWIARLSDWIVGVAASGRPLAASCFGHQLVAKTYGGEVRANEDGWMVGNYRLDIHAEHAWMEPGVQRSVLYHFNRERVHRLPAGARSFAHSETYPDFAYTIGDNVLCIQGHPEQPLRAMNNFLRATRHLMSEAERQRARGRLDDGEPDAALWGRWLSNFLRGH